MIINSVLLVIVAFSGGVIIAGGVFALIAIIGIVPRLAQRTNTEKYIMIYEDSIMAGGILGTSSLILSLYIPFGVMGLSSVGFFAGVFIGCLAVSIAEIIDVIPVLTRRIKIKTGMAYFIVALAIGKLIGALVYFIIPGFAVYK